MPGGLSPAIRGSGLASRSHMRPNLARFRGAVILAFSLLALSPSDAWAYVDPGTGSYLFQLAAAGFLAGAYTLRRYWHSVVARLRGNQSTGEDEPADPLQDGK